MLSLCRYLLYLYPPAHRLEFGEEMVAVLRERWTELQTNGVVMRSVFWTREIGGLLCGAIQEHTRVLGDLNPRVEFPLRRRLGMRSEFRFPKATGWLMVVIVGAVVMAIEKAKAISDSLPSTDQFVGPIQPEKFTTVWTFAAVLAGACVTGAIGWAVLFALRRSGIQRLSELRPSGDGGAHGKVSD